MACSPGPEASASASSAETQSSDALPAGTPVVLISIDTLRSDRLPAYGYDQVETPAIDRLRADSVLFERAYAHMSLTLPSHASMLTGLRPDQSGVRDNVGYRVAEDTAFLPAILQREGYATGAAVSAYVLRASTGMARGFDRYDDGLVVESGVDLGSLQRPGLETLARAREWLSEVDADSFFLFFHIYEPHSPYRPSEPFASRWDDPYDAEVAEADAIVGELLDALRQHQAYDRALVILLSDHGEGLMDHGEQEHEVLLYREVLQVPLLVKLPGGRLGGSSVAAPAQLSDVMPTVLGLLGMDVPGGDRIAGRNLFDAAAASPRAVLSESQYPRIHFGWSELVSVIEDDWHLIDGPRPELYDIGADPAEQNDLIGAHPDRAERMRKRLAALDREVAAPSAVDEETRAALQALGYATASSAAPEGDQQRANPVDKVGVLSELGEAARLLLAGQADRAVAAYRRITSQEPGMVYAWEQLGKSLRRVGDDEEARRALEQALELSGGAGSVALSLADLELDAGRLEQAEGHARVAAASHESAWDLLAQIALRRDDLAAAAEHVERAVAQRGGRIEPLITLAELRVRQERYDEALVVADQVLEEYGDRTDYEVLRGLHFQRGLAYASLGELEAATEALKTEIELSPQELAPYTRLALVYALQGAAEEMGSTLRSMIERNPHPLAYAEAVRTLRAVGDQASAARLLAIAQQQWPGAEALRGL